jgi:hypothetical protein
MVIHPRDRKTVMFSLVTRAHYDDNERNFL